MYKIVFKGDLEPIYLNVHEGMKLADDLKNDALEEFVTLKGSTIATSSIKAILPIIEDEKTETMDKISEINSDWELWKKKRLALSPKDRAQSTSFMNLLCQALRGRPLTELEVKDVQFSQQVWFEQHPDFHTANPICYFSREEISRCQAGLENLGGPLTIADALKVNVLNLAERILT